LLGCYVLAGMLKVVRVMDFTQVNWVFLAVTCTSHWWC